MSTSSPAASVEQALAYVDDHRDVFLEELKAFLRIPSVSTDPQRAPEMRRAATFLVDELKRIGLSSARLIETARHPLVYAEWLEATGKPTVLIYGHYDVQPVDPLAEWKSNPFEPEVRGDNLYARGAVDDKGQVYGLVKALEALMRTEGALPVNVRVLIEGEEEEGGTSIEEYVKRHAKELACDAVLISDTGMMTPGIPELTYGLRGILYTEIEAKGAQRDLHSGSYGGVAPNPIYALALILTGLKGADGHITIPELYDRAPQITDEERALWKRNPVDLVAGLKREMGVEALPGEQEYDPRERIGARPTLEVHGIRGGFVEEGQKTVIPAEAVAKVSLRLPPGGMKAAEVFPLLVERVRELTPEGVTVTVRNLHRGDGVLVPLDNVYIRAAERALEQEWGRPPVFERTGGSIPIAALFDSELHAPIIFMGTGLPDDNLHAPNEKYHLPYYYKGIRQAVRFLSLLGSDPAIVSRPHVADARPKPKGARSDHAASSDKAKTPTKAKSSGTRTRKKTSAS